MKLLFRFVLPLLLALGALAYALVPLVFNLTERWFIRDLDLRSKLIITSIQDTLEPQLVNVRDRDAKKNALKLLRKVTEDERIMGIGFCTPDEELLIKTEVFPKEVNCSDIRNAEPYAGITRHINNGFVHVSYGYILTPAYLTPNNEIQKPLGKLVFVHDMTFVSRRAKDTRNYLFIFFLGIGLVTVGVTVAVAKWSQASWLTEVRDLVRKVRRKDPINLKAKYEFHPILKDLRRLVRDLEQSEDARDELRTNWDAKALKDILTNELFGEEILVVSNREPYIHNQKAGKIEVQRPASGLVTAVEPILRACSGVWVAHGSGSADKLVVDKNDRIRVPPHNPQYDIHRVWLTHEQELGYYYGFSNEGIWPLCHIAHNRPTFRKNDWEKYVQVNEKFAQAVVADAQRKDPVVFVHDYHFALVPRFLRDKLPDATIITFWHIPWPNPESFGICPWRNEILDGLLASSILGFHTQFHCNNFIDCVDRFMESRIDRETNSISYNGNLTAVRAYPISIEWPPQNLENVPNVEESKKIVRQNFNLTEDIKIGVGIDRLDYTKGILERFRAVERLFEIEPKWIGKFTFIQIAAPSRSSIPAYQTFQFEVHALAEKINARFGSDSYLPIQLLIEHHESSDVFTYFRAADVCVASSLHDGMNLVAKEFIATREDEQGVLILSMFTGASRELVEALIINPYDIEQTAMALNKSLHLSKEEQRQRMRLLRSIVKEYNVFRWAGRMLLDAAIIRSRHRLGHL